MALKRTKVVLDFEASTLLDLRKLLFKSDLTVQQFFTYVVDKTITHDEKLIELIHEAREYKTMKSLKNSEELDAEAIYALIEKGDDI
jgi:hypothetical protein